MKSLILKVLSLAMSVTSLSLLTLSDSAEAATLLAPTSAQLSSTAHAAHGLEVDLNSTELREMMIRKGLLRADGSGHMVIFNLGGDDSIDQGLRYGERLLKWVDLINGQREDSQKIRLTSPQTRRSYPITAPNRYSPRTVERDLAALRQVMPVEMQEVLFNQGQMSATNPVSDEDFIKYGRDLDRIYQTSARWTMLIDYKQSYIANRVRDVRGYYFLSTNNWNAQTLTQWAQLDTAVIAQIKEAFLGICINNRVGATRCQQRTNEVNSGAKAVEFYNRYIARAKAAYDEFFEISGNRNDIEWDSKAADIAMIPFIDPVKEDVRSFIKDNIEEEFSWKGWGLKIQFATKHPAPYVVFIPGVTANVEYLGGNKIEMDANKSLYEYEERWTIRHEFGHVLGFPDCYQEFYDDQNDEFINYQLDVTDLMCSRAGNFTERMHMQLRDAYMR